VGGIEYTSTNPPSPFRQRKLPTFPPPSLPSVPFLWLKYKKGFYWSLLVSEMLKMWQRCGKCEMIDWKMLKFDFKIEKNVKKKILIESHVVLPIQQTHMPGTNCQNLQINFPDIYPYNSVKIRIQRDFRVFNVIDCTLKNGTIVIKMIEKKLIYLLPWVSDMLFQRDFSVKRRNCWCWCRNTPALKYRVDFLKVL